MWPVTARFLEALNSGNYKAVSKVEVWTGSGIYLAVLPTITAGSVTVDETRAIRRQLSLIVVSNGREILDAEGNPMTDAAGIAFAWDDWVPVLASDLLHPSTGNELKVFSGIDYEDDSPPEWVPLGVFRMSKPQVDDSGGSITVAISGNDRSAEFSRRIWQKPLVLANGTDVSSAVGNMVQSRWPGLLMNLSPTNPAFDGNMYTTGKVVFGANITTGQNDPWQDVASVAAIAGMEILFDVSGVFILRPVINPQNAGVVATFTD